MQARFYDAQVGRFLSTDPLDDEFSLYAYVRNDPLNGVDPTGTECNKQLTACNADTFDAARATIDVKRETGIDDAVVAARGDYQKATPQGGEPTGNAAYTETGAVKVTPTASTKGQTATADTAKFDISNGDAGVHGHLGGSVVDDPSANGGYGDSQSLEFGKAMYTVEGGRVGARDAPNGQLRFEMLRGKMTRKEAAQVLRNLNVEQRKFLKPSP